MLKRQRGIALRKFFRVGGIVGCILSAAGCTAPSSPSANPGGRPGPVAKASPSTLSFEKAVAAYKRNNLEDAGAGFLEAAKLAKSEGNDANYQNALQRLCWVYQDRGKYAEARKVLFGRNGWPPEQQTKFKTAQLIAYAHTSKYDADGLSQVEKRDAVRFCRGGLAMLQPYLGRQDPGLVKLYSILARVYLSDKNYQDAEDPLLQIRAIREGTTGPDSIAYADANMQLATVYLDWCTELLSKDSGFANPSDMLTEAANSLSGAEKIYSTLLGGNDPRVAEAKEKQQLCATLLAKAKKLDLEPSKSGSAKLTPNGELPPFEP
ncbi:MAG: hypothetical protein K2W95_33840 [Candidatus Obscuribacterales bacterium]|nr:hypothetical protein [Candidatus Obscuribacterales bacterium]